jgi:hypothetical protein
MVFILSYYAHQGLQVNIIKVSRIFRIQERDLKLASGGEGGWTLKDQLPLLPMALGMLWRI